MPEMVIIKSAITTKKWDSEKIKKLKKLSEQGLSTSSIAKKLGVSKNSVVGKLYRLGWNASAVRDKNGNPEFLKAQDVEFIQIKPKRVLSERQKLKQREYHLKYRQTHRDVLRERSKQYRLKHPDVIRKYLAEHKDEMTKKRIEYREANKEYVQQQARDYYAANHDKYMERALKWREQNRERINAYAREYREKNKDKTHAASKRYYQKKKEERLQCLEEIQLLKANVQELQNQLNALQQKNPYKDGNIYMYA